MNLHHRLMRQTINIALNKAIEDMSSNTKRSIRNLIDLGLLFSQSENQKWFFGTAKKVISDVRNPYHELISRIIADVDIETIKTIGLNLGYSSLTYGAHTLQKRQAAMGVALPWVLVFDAPQYTPVFFERTEAFINEGRELGIYTYIFCPKKEEDMGAITKIAGYFKECVFVLKMLPELITEQSVAWIRKVHNILVSVQVPDTGDDESGRRAFHLLKNNRCLYGFHVGCHENNIDQVATPEYIRWAIALGNTFGMYIADQGVPGTCRDALYDFVCSERGEAGLPLVAFDWFRDMQDVSGRIQAQSGYMVINPGEEACQAEAEAEGWESSLFDRIRRITSYVMPGNLRSGATLG